MLDASLSLQLQLLTRPICCHRTLPSRDAESACSGCMRLQGREWRRIQRLVRLANIVGPGGTTSGLPLEGCPVVAIFDINPSCPNWQGV